MKIVTAEGKKKLVLNKSEWEQMGKNAGWMTADGLMIEAKKMKHSPTEHGFIDECIEKNKDKDDPGAYCASIVDKAKGTTTWRKKD